MYPNMEAYLLCAAVDDKPSVENLLKWMSELKSSRVHKRPIVLHLTKCDLKLDETISAETLVGQQLVNQMASKLQVADLFYCSAKTGENVEVAFKRAAELAIRSDQKGKSKCVIV
ncbi:unnamed protein product [Dicrocoelium dendriticum]|nr:unnamed protein product [Dicrocoelium dendriticum]